MFLAFLWDLKKDIIDDVTAMIAGRIRQIAPMDQETVGLFQQLAKKMIEQAGESSKKNYLQEMRWALDTHCDL